MNRLDSQSHPVDRDRCVADDSDVSRPPIHELFVVIGSYVAVVGYAVVAVYGVGL